MKSFAVAALMGAASAAWAPPAYGGNSEAPASSSAPEAPAYGGESSTMAAPATSSAPEAPAYGQSSTEAAPVTTSSAARGYPHGYGSSSSMMTAYGTGSSAVAPKPTGGYGGSWGSGNGTQGGYGGHGGDSYVTQVVTSFETYCPYATTLTYNSKTYTVSSETTLTVTDCPCEVTTPAQSYKPVMTTDVVTSFTTVCPEAGTHVWGPSTYTVSKSQTLTVTDCEGGCSVTSEVPATWVVPTYSTVCPSPVAPTTVTVGTQTYPVTDETTIVVTAPTSYATMTSVISKPAQPTSYVIESTTYPVTEQTTIVYTMPTQGGVTVTAPYSSIYTAPPAQSTPAGPVPNYPAPSGYAPSGNGSSPVSPNMPVQTGNGAERILAGGAAFGAVVIGALFM